MGSNPVQALISQLLKLCAQSWKVMEKVSHSGAFSYKDNTAERGGCSSFFFCQGT